MADIDINKLPSAVKGLRACLQCKMIKTREQFQVRMGAVAAFVPTVALEILSHPYPIRRANAEKNIWRHLKIYFYSGMFCVYAYG